MVLVWALDLACILVQLQVGFSPSAQGFAKALILPSAQSSFSGDSRAIYRRVKSHYLLLVKSWQLDSHWDQTRALSIEAVVGMGTSSHGSPGWRQSPCGVIWGPACEGWLLSIKCEGSPHPGLGAFASWTAVSLFTFPAPGR